MLGTLQNSAKPFSTTGQTTPTNNLHLRRSLLNTTSSVMARRQTNTHTNPHSRGLGNSYSEHERFTNQQNIIFIYNCLHLLGNERVRLYEYGVGGKKKVRFLLREPDSMNSFQLSHLPRSEEEAIFYNRLSTATQKTTRSR